MESPWLPTSAGPIYLDHAAATPLEADVAAVMHEAAAAFANPSSPHAAGRAAKRTLETAREQILHLVGARTSGPDRDRLVFTSGATEANRLGILGTAAAGVEAGRSTGWVAVSARDHASIRSAAADLVIDGWQRFETPLTPMGRLDLPPLAAALRTFDQPVADHGAGATAPRILAITSVCGQTGIREDLAAVAGMAADVSGLRVHIDATQAAGWDELLFTASGATTLALAPHKFGGPRGIGGLVVRGTARLAAVVPGPQELGLRGGTEAVALAAGFACALERAVADRHTQASRVAALRQRLETGLLTAAHEAGIEAVVVGRDAPRAPHVSLVALASCDRQVIAMAADLAGVCLATGTACASGSSEPPAVLPALGLEPRFHQGGIRLSLGRATTAAEIEVAIGRLAAIFHRLGRRHPAAGKLSIG